MTFNQIFLETILQTKDTSDGFLCHLLIEALRKETQRRTDKKVNWDAEIILRNERKDKGFKYFWFFVRDVFIQYASALASTENDLVYKQATKIAEILREIIVRETLASLPELRIMPCHLLMAEAGLVNFTSGPDGQTMVTLSEEGEKVAEEVETEFGL